MLTIESKENNFFKELKKLKEKKYRTKEGKYIIEGFRFVQEALKADADVQSIVISEEAKNKLHEYIDENSIKDKKVYILKTSLFNMLCSTENPQGILAVVGMNKSFHYKEGEFYILVDKVQDPGNMGTIIRTAHAAGVDGVIVTKGTVDMYNDKTLRSTMGSIFYIPVIEDDDLAFTRNLIKNGFKVVISSLQANENFFEADLRGKTIITVGNEGNGVSEEVSNLGDTKIKIPMPGNAESLNVSTAASIMIFEKVRQNLIK
ncbi:RNA methyltransferase [Clostridium polyendosporum]|uniref:RNA methyltransferase n=1 Tax=Clostridium polyendosporum TaxID=69208 RepID=A0A919S038_9CLOT|nr:RNA methyltransferase [Clostridium polyendosporum]GIM28690.1 RNA methyltransferase [Clostridium polyendosporum]